MIVTCIVFTNHKTLNFYSLPFSFLDASFAIRIRNGGIEQKGKQQMAIHKSEGRKGENEVQEKNYRMCQPKCGLIFFIWCLMDVTSFSTGLHSYLLALRADNCMIFNIFRWWKAYAFN